MALISPDWRFTVLTGSGTDAWGTGSNVSFQRIGAGIYGVAEQVALLRRTPPDATLFWAPHYNAPLLVRVPTVVTVHDLGHLRLQEFTRSLLRSAYARFMFSQARRRAAGILYVSEFSRTEFHDVVGRPRGIEAVVHHGVDAAWFEQPSDAPPLARPYFVYLGNVKPHKNLHVLLDAFTAVRDTLGAQLVIIGRSENFRTSDTAVAARVARTPHVAMVGELDDALVRRYLRHAAALVMPSLYEGFGLPPLEAMAAGCPALVSSAGSLPEVCGDAASYFDPRDPRALSELMLRVVQDDAFRSALTARGRARVRSFDWDVSARATRTLLAEAMAA